MLQSIESKHCHKMEKLNNKFIKLQENAHSCYEDNITNLEDNMLNKDLVKNLSTETFTDAEINFLSKGLNFSIEPLNQHELLFVDVESNLKKINNSDKTKIKTDIFHAVNKSNSLKNNTSKTSIKNKHIIQSLQRKNVFYLKPIKVTQLSLWIKMSIITE